MFGCLCYASTIFVNKDKFQPKAQACVLLGYPLAIKGYKLLNLASKHVFVSRDVVFHEHIFPFQSVDSIYSSPSHVPISFPSLNDTTSTLTSLPMDSSSSPVYHDSYFHDQHFAPNVDSNSDLEDDSTILLVQVRLAQDTLATSTPSVESIPLVPSSFDSTTVAPGCLATSGPHLPSESPPTAPSQLSPPSQTP